MPTLSEAITAIKAGRINEARVMLTRILAQDRNNVTALLWMTEVATTPEEVRIYLKRVLAIDPTNAPARRGLELLDKANEQPRVATGQLSPHQPASINTANDHPRKSPMRESLNKQLWRHLHRLRFQHPGREGIKPKR